MYRSQRKLCFESLDERGLFAANLHADSVVVTFGARPVTDAVVGEQVVFTANFTSADLVEGSQFSARILIDGQPFDSRSYTASAETTRSYRWNSKFWFARPGEHSIELRVDADSAIAESDEVDNSASVAFTPAAPTLPSKFVFPLAGQIMRDWFITAYVDVDAQGQGDYRGGLFHYEGHYGVDIRLSKQFKAVDRGVPVYAMASGTVSEAADGNFDRQTLGLASPTAPNYVYIDHGNEIHSAYAHLTSGSVTVQRGDRVVAGQLLGLDASSGAATGPHLHIEVWHHADRTIETFIAPDLYFAAPVPYFGDLPTTVLDSGVTNYDFATRLFNEPKPSENKEGPSEVRVFPVSANWDVTYWSLAIPFQVNDLIETRWFRPDGVLEKADSQTYVGPEKTNNSAKAPTVVDTWLLEHDRWSRFPGTWQVAHFVNGRELDRQSFEVTQGPGLPEIRLSRGDTYIVDGRTTPIDFPNASTTPRSLNFTIQNHGSVELTTGGLVLPPGFSLVGPFPASVAAGSTTEFNVQLDNAVPGQKYGEIRFLTNDADEGVFTFNVKGRVSGAPPAGTPNITRTNRPAATYINSGDPALIAPAATVTDDDSANFNSGRLIVEFASGGTVDDRLSIRNQGQDAEQIGTNNGTISFGGVPIGDFTGGEVSSPLVVTFNSNATPPAVEALVRNLTFENPSPQPTTNIRFVRLTLVDDTGKVSNLALSSVVVDPRIGGTSSGDFNSDGVVNSTDMDLIHAAISAGSSEPRFDLTGDSGLDKTDVDELLREILGTSYGDANLDRVFNSSDLVLIFQAGQYEDSVIGNSRWSTGDWDGDLEFTTSDLILAFQSGAYRS